MLSCTDTNEPAFKCIWWFNIWVAAIVAGSLFKTVYVLITNFRTWQCVTFSTYCTVIFLVWHLVWHTPISLLWMDLVSVAHVEPLANGNIHAPYRINSSHDRKLWWISCLDSQTRVGEGKIRSSFVISAGCWLSRKLQQRSGYDKRSMAWIRYNSVLYFAVNHTSYTASILLTICIWRFCFQQLAFHIIVEEEMFNQIVRRRSLIHMIHALQENYE